MSHKPMVKLFWVLILCVMLISSPCLANTPVDTTQTSDSLSSIESLVYLSTGFEQQISDKDLEDNKNFQVVSSFEALLKAFYENPDAAIIIDKNAVPLIDEKVLQGLMTQYNPVILVGYCELSDGVIIGQQKISQFIGGDSVRCNGFSAMVVNNGRISQAGAFTRSNRTFNELIGFVNRVNQLEVAGGYLDNPFQSETILNNPEESMASELSDMNTGDPSVSSAGNHLIRIYDSTDTNRNKVYGSRDTSNIVSNLYRGEAIMDMQSQSITTSGGTTITWNKVEYYNGSSYQTGYMIYSIDNGDEWWAGGFLWCSTMEQFIEDHRSNYSSYLARRNANGKNYYGIKARASSAIYSSNNQLITNTSSSDWLWVTGQNYCGSTYHNYMTIQGYSTSKTGTITDYSSTTFFNAKFNNSNPTNYAIWTRLP